MIKQKSIFDYFTKSDNNNNSIINNDNIIEKTLPINQYRNKIEFYFNKINDNFIVNEYNHSINNDHLLCNNESTDLRIEVYTDGSSINNGKRNCKASWAFIIYENDVLIERKYGICNKQNVGYDIQSNQKAELMGIYCAILKCNEKYQNSQTIYIYSDSLYSIKCITDWSNKWNQTDWDIKKNTIIIKNIKNSIKKHNYIFIHIRGHQDKSTNKHHIRNCIVDKETKKAFKPKVL